jgi:hypothetical protein
LECEEIRIDEYTGKEFFFTGSGSASVGIL